MLRELIHLPIGWPSLTSGYQIFLQMELKGFLFLFEILLYNFMHMRFWPLPNLQLSSHQNRKRYFNLDVKKLRTHQHPPPQPSLENQSWVRERNWKQTTYDKFTQPDRISLQWDSRASGMWQMVTAAATFGGRNIAICFDVRVQCWS